MYPSSAQAFQSLQGFTNSRKSSKDILGEAENKYDIPGYTTRLSKLRGLVGNLQSSVEAVDPSVTGRTSGTFTTEGQRQALVSKERAPILGDLSKQQGALGQEQEGFNTAANLAGTLASTLMKDDDTKYQSLLDQYNATTAQEQQAEAKRQFEENLKFQREQAAAAAKAAGGGGAGGYDIGGLLSSIMGGGSTGSKAAPSIQDQAYQNAQKFLKLNDTQLLSDWLATLKSANNGNAMDKIKIQLYSQARPDIAKKVSGNQAPGFGVLARPTASTASKQGSVLNQRYY